MRRSTALSAFALVLVTAGGGTPCTAGAAQDQSPGQRRGTLLDRVPRHGTLRVCTTGDCRPFSYHDAKTGGCSGIDSGMAKNPDSSLGVRTRFAPSTWAGLMDDLTAGKCDLGMGGISVTLARAQNAYFSSPYLTDGKAAITRCADKDTYPSLDAIDKPGSASSSTPAAPRRSPSGPTSTRPPSSSTPTTTASSTRSWPVVPTL
ncbi:transporter substrate-binding domain-containing protein [Streptomyces sp. NPDC101225]|uniref:transporter substrate-binding domain-containing protein n=1 Tax=Streptomyces sp. NPDC101225 TaxID=3366135 RepID=UPI0038051EAC